MTTNYEELIPKKVLLSIKDLNDYGIIKSDMCRKLVHNRELEVVKMGYKNYFTRTEIIRYLTSRTISVVNQNEPIKQSA